MRQSMMRPAALPVPAESCMAGSILAPSARWLCRVVGALSGWGRHVAGRFPQSDFCVTCFYPGDPVRKVREGGKAAEGEKGLGERQQEVSEGGGKGGGR